MSTMTVYTVEYLQIADLAGGQRRTWVVFGHFFHRADAERAIRDPQRERVIEEEMDEDLAFDECQ